MDMDMNMNMDIYKPCLHELSTKMSDHPSQLALMRASGVSHVDVDHYLESGIRSGSELMTLDEYADLEVHETGGPTGDSYAEVRIVSFDDGTKENIYAEEFFSKDIKQWEKAMNSLRCLSFEQIAAIRLLLMEGAKELPKLTADDLP